MVRKPMASSLQKQTERAGKAQTPPTDSTSLLRALAILELIAQKPGGLTNGEISRRLNIATSTASYILSRLERSAYIKRNAQRGRYEISLKVIALAHGALREMGLRKAAEPALHRLVAHSTFSGLVGVLDRGLVMIVDKVEQPSLARIDMDIGVRYPAHTTALGRVLLAHLPADQLSDLLNPNTKALPASRTNIQIEQLSKDLAVVRKNGYAISDGDLFLNVWAAAAPVFDASGNVLAAVSATGIPKPKDEDAVISQVMQTAKEISVKVAESESRKLS